MSLKTAEATAVTAILDAVSTAMNAKTEGERYVGDRPGVFLVGDIIEEVKKAAHAYDFSDVAAGDA